MAKIPKRVIDEIRERTSIVEVVGDYVSLKKEGANYKGLCPFHNEKTPSFKVHEDKKIFKCFGCGEAGDVFRFLMKVENMSFQAVAETLARRLGIALPREERGAEQEAEDEEIKKLFALNEAAAAFFHELLLSSSQQAEDARAYLQHRGFGKEALIRYRLGFAPFQWRVLLESFKARGYSEDELLAAGLVIRNEKGNIYDRFRGRIIFPITDVQGRVRGFGGRVLSSEDQPKYLNSPETKLFKKGASFFGLYQAKQAIREKDAVVVVEGYFDQIALDQAGVRNAVATLGTALTREHARVLKRYSRNIFLVFDGDEAGKKAALRSLEPFLEEGVIPRAVLLPAGQDPDDFLKERGGQEFENLLLRSRTLFDFFMDEKLSSAGDLPAARAGAVAEISALLARIPDPVEREIYANRLSSRTGVSLEEVRARIRRPRTRSADEKEARPEKSAHASTAFPRPEADLLVLLLLHPEVADMVRESGVAEEFIHPGLARMVKKILAEPELLKGAGFTELAESSEEPEVAELIHRAAFLEDPYREKAPQAASELVAGIKRANLNQKLVKLKREIQSAQEQGAESKWRALLEEQNRLLEEQRRLGTGSRAD